MNNKYLEKIAEEGWSNQHKAGTAAITTAGSMIPLPFADTAISHLALRQHVPENRKDNWYGMHHVGHGIAGSLLGSTIGGGIGAVVGSHVGKETDVLGYLKNHPSVRNIPNIENTIELAEEMGLKNKHFKGLKGALLGSVAGGLAGHYLGKLHHLNSSSDFREDGPETTNHSGKGALAGVALGAGAGYHTGGRIMNKMLDMAEADEIRRGAAISRYSPKTRAYLAEEISHTPLPKTLKWGGAAALGLGGLALGASAGGLWKNNNQD